MTQSERERTYTDFNGKQPTYQIQNNNRSITVNKANDLSSW
jgi:hypothetical protein